MNVLELIKELEKIQSNFELYEKKYYTEYHGIEYKSPDVRLRIKTLEVDHDDLENYWLDTAYMNCGSGYEEHPEVVLDDTDEEESK